jgi:cellulose synthase/poly-beta-1,6-N-acetylglucosamine synthase-like glycosyltransferase
MLSKLPEFLICLLAAYGMLVLILGAIDLIRFKIASDRPKVRIVILVQNAQEQIEFIVRNVVVKDYASKILSDKKIIFMDINSEDDTAELLEKLQQCYPSIEVVQYKDKDKIFNGFQPFSPVVK